MQNPKVKQGYIIGKDRIPNGSLIQPFGKMRMQQED